MLAVDFFHVDCKLTLRLYVLSALEVSDRYLHILGVTGQPDGPWTTSNLVMNLDEHAARLRFVASTRAEHWVGPLSLSAATSSMCAGHPSGR